MLDQDELLKVSIFPPICGNGEASVPCGAETGLSVVVVARDELGGPVAIKHVSVSIFRHAFFTKYRREKNL